MTVAIVANGVAFYWLRHRTAVAAPAKRSQEMVLGTFEYNRVNPRDKQVKHGRIVVTLHLAVKLNAAKFREVHNQETRLQAAVEEAMRRLRMSDLADPRFIRVRNQFQEHLNDALGFDGIDEVIVTKAPEPAADPAPESAVADTAAPESGAPPKNVDSQYANPQATGGAANASADAASADGATSDASSSSATPDAGAN